MKRKEAIKKATERWGRWCSKYCDEVFIKILTTLVVYIVISIKEEHHK